MRRTTTVGTGTPGRKTVTPSSTLLGVGQVPAHRATTPPQGTPQTLQQGATAPRQLRVPGPAVQLLPLTPPPRGRPFLPVRKLGRKATPFLRLP